MGLFWGVGSFLNQKFTLQIVDMYIRTVFVPKWGRGGKGQIHPFWHGKASLGEISPLMWGDLPSLFPVERGGAGRGANGKLGGAGRAEQSWLFGEDSGWRGSSSPLAHLPPLSLSFALSDKPQRMESQLPALVIFIWSSCHNFHFHHQRDKYLRNTLKIWF